MKKKIFIGVGIFLGIIVIAAGVLYIFVMRPAFEVQAEVRQMAIEKVTLAAVPDGTYTGEFIYSSVITKVAITVKDHKIESIDILERGEGEHPDKAAAGIVKRVMEKQTLDVEVVTGATTSSKALLKAMENALKSNYQTKKQ